MTSTARLLDKDAGQEVLTIMIYRWDAIDIREFSAIKRSVLRGALYIDVDSAVYEEDEEPAEIRECCEPTLLGDDEADELYADYCMTHAAQERLQRCHLAYLAESISASQRRTS